MNSAQVDFLDFVRPRFEPRAKNDVCIHSGES